MPSRKNILRVSVLALFLLSLCPPRRVPIFAQRDVALKLQYQFPANAATAVQRQTGIIIRPGDLINHTTVKASLLKVTGAFSGLHTGSFVLADDKKTLVFTPKFAFTYSERVRVSLSRGILTTAGKPVDSVSFYFTIQSKPHSGHFQILSLPDSVIGGGSAMDQGAVPVSSLLSAPSFANVYPNPAGSVVNVSISLAQDMPADVRVFDAMGHEVAILASGPLHAGTHTLTFDASNAPNGVYYCVLRAAGSILTKQIVIAK